MQVNKEVVQEDESLKVGGKGVGTGGLKSRYLFENQMDQKSALVGLYEVGVLQLGEIGEGISVVGSLELVKLLDGT